MRFSKNGWLTIILVVAVAGLATAFVLFGRNQGQKLAGRHSEYHKVYDGWWDVACDTAMDGGDRRCYVQFVDIYSPRPNFRAAMVEVVYRRSGDGAGEPVITFDIEPDLSFTGAEIAIIRPDGSQHLLPIGACSGPDSGPKCPVSGDPAAGMLKQWRQGESLSLTIREKDGSKLERRWPLGKINAILDDFDAQRRARNLP